MKFTKDNLKVAIYPHRALMGQEAAADIKKCFSDLLSQKPGINVIFAAAPSQNDVLKCLASDTDIDWGSINAYHMDEYIGLEKDAPQTFGNYLKNHIFSLVPFKSVNCIDASAADPAAEAERYSRIIRDNPPDVVILGIGENGHIAFNDPHIADFNDKKTVKAVKLDDVCRRQQVNDGCFRCFNEVPQYALTLTVPALVSAKYMFCVVPAESKANAVYRTLNGDIDESCPATVLRRHPNAKLYLDLNSAKFII